MSFHRIIDPKYVFDASEVQGLFQREADGNVRCAFSAKDTNNGDAAFSLSEAETLSLIEALHAVLEEKP